MPYLSHSQTETWAQCPRKWALTKIEGAPQAPSDALCLGSAVHEVFEQDGQELMRGFDSNDTRLHVWLDGALDATIARDDPRGLIGQSIIDDMRAKGHAIIAAYIQHLRPRYQPVAIEQSFDVAIEGTSWRFTGRIDAEAVMPDGTLAILDMKTGKPWDTGDEHKKPQASAYLWAAYQRSVPTSCVVFCIFPTVGDGYGGYICRPQFRTTTRTGEQLEAYERYLVATTEAITAARYSNDFPVRLSKLCSFCGVRGSCPEGEAHLIQIGYAARVPSVKRQVEVKP